MNKCFFSKLALNNIEKNRRTYIPYVMTCIGAMVMFYTMIALAYNKSLLQVTYGEETQIMLKIGVKLIGFFSVIFLFYTNSFLIKRRKKEFGLYNILGMEKKHITKMIFIEVVDMTVISLIFGIGLGILFSKAMLLAVANIIKTGQSSIKFEVPGKAVAITVILFVCIFFCIFLKDLTQIHLAKPIELLKGGEKGEKEPKTKWLTALVGIITIGIGYAICIKVENPMETVGMFMIAVVLVMIGTYCSFIAVSIVILKMLKKNKKFYYKVNHFASVSGMIYRMKQNAVGLANICILGTGVLIMVSSTVSLYWGVEDAVKKMVPWTVTGEVYCPYKNSDKILKDMEKVMLETLGKEQEVIYYRTTSFTVKFEDNKILPDSSSSKDLINILTVEDYNRLENKKVSLADDEVLVYGHSLSDKVKIGKKSYRVKEQLTSYKESEIPDGYLKKNTFLIMKDAAEVKKASKISDQHIGNCLTYGVKNSLDKAEQLDLTEQLEKKIVSQLDTYKIRSYNVIGQEDERAGVMAIYGSLMFMGIFLAALFVMAVVLIMYYKQITEGYEDKERFAIMKKVGMDKKEIKSTIRSQVLLLFFLPLGVSLIHVSVAYVLIKKMLLMLGLANPSIFLVGTITSVAIFAVLYCVIYLMTAKVYYKIVE